MNTLSTLGDRLKHVRGTTPQAAFSLTFGINQNTLSRYERNERIPDADLIALICRTTGILPAWLLLGDGPMYSRETPSEPQPPESVSTLPLQCPRCARLDEKLERAEEERRELSNENRQWAIKMEQVLRENADLRERCAKLEERHSCGHLRKTEDILRTDFNKIS